MRAVVADWFDGVTREELSSRGAVLRDLLLVKVLPLERLRNASNVAPLFCWALRVVWEFDCVERCCSELRLAVELVESGPRKVSARFPRNALNLSAFEPLPARGARVSADPVRGFEVTVVAPFVNG